MAMRFIYNKFTTDPIPIWEPWCRNLYLNLLAISGVNIPAPWSMWDGSKHSLCQTLSVKVLHPPNYTKLYPTHCLARYLHL